MPATVYEVVRKGDAKSPEIVLFVTPNEELAEMTAAIHQQWADEGVAAERRAGKYPKRHFFEVFERPWAPEEQIQYENSVREAKRSLGLTEGGTRWPLSGKKSCR